MTASVLQQSRFMASKSHLKLPVTPFQGRRVSFFHHPSFFKTIKITATSCRTAPEFKSILEEANFSKASFQKKEWNYIGTSMGKGLPHATGVAFHKATGDTFEGQWKNGVPHGIGTYSNSKGERYEGEWENGVRHGWGSCQFSNGFQFEGQWKNGLPHVSHKEETAKPHSHRDSFDALLAWKK